MGFLAGIVNSGRNKAGAKLPSVSPTVMPATVSAGPATPVSTRSTPGPDSVASSAEPVTKPTRSTKPTSPRKPGLRASKRPGHRQNQDQSRLSQPPPGENPGDREISGQDIQGPRTSNARPQISSVNMDHSSQGGPHGRSHQTAPGNFRDSKDVVNISQDDSATTPGPPNPTIVSEKSHPAHEKDTPVPSSLDENTSGREIAGKFIARSKSQPDHESARNSREALTRVEYREKQEKSTPEKPGTREVNPVLSDSQSLSAVGPQPEPNDHREDAVATNATPQALESAPEPQEIHDLQSQLQPVQSSSRNTAPRATHVHIGQVNVVVRAAETPVRHGRHPERPSAPGSSILLRGV